MSDLERDNIIPFIAPKDNTSSEVPSEPDSEVGGMLGAFSGGHKCDGRCKKSEEDPLDRIRKKLGHIQHIENQYQITHDFKEREHLAFHIIILIQSTFRSIERVILRPAAREEILRPLFKIRHRWTKKFPDLATKRFSVLRQEKVQKRADAAGLVSNILLRHPIIFRKFAAIDCTYILAPSDRGTPSLFGRHLSPPLDQQ